MKEVPKIFDRNGREIKLGDRVRVISDEVNKYLHDYFGEDWIPEMHQGKDEFGTAQLTKKYGEYVIGDEWDEVLYSFYGYADGEKEICLEVVDE